MDHIREVVRHYARAVAKFLHTLSRGQVSANTITFTSVAGHIPTAFLIGSGHWLWAAALLLFFGLFDVLDGELARLQKTASPRGMLLDATTDRIKEILLYTGAAYWISVSPSCGMVICSSFGLRYFPARELRQGQRRIGNCRQSGPRRAP